MSEVVFRWLEAVREKDLKRAAAFWFRAPVSLAVSFSSNFTRLTGTTFKSVYSDDEYGEIFRISTKEEGDIIDVGMLKNEGHPVLVSPETVLRRVISRNWYRWGNGQVILVAERKTLISESVKSCLQDILERIIDFMGKRVKPFYYFVPTKETLQYFRNLNRRFRGNFNSSRRSWTDPFGGDVISGDPSDAHELTHGCSISLAGWPPLFMREGIAECFAPTYDWRHWQRLERFPRLLDLWQSCPGDMCGWYTSAAVFIAMIYRYFGGEFLWECWDKLDENADLYKAARFLKLPVETLEKRFREFCEKITGNTHISNSCGLIPCLRGKI